MLCDAGNEQLPAYLFIRKIIAKDLLNRQESFYLCGLNKSIYKHANVKQTYEHSASILREGLP